MRTRWATQSRVRRAAVVVYVAVSVTAIMGIGALAIDLGMVYAAKAELQRTADAAALAAAGHLIHGGTEDFEDDMLASADLIAELNSVLGAEMNVNASDVEFGRAVTGDGSRWAFQESGAPFDALRITLRRAEGADAGPIETIFARFFGNESTNVSARAAAMLIPRDVAVVIDVSNSMCYDSTLKFWNRDDGGSSNLRDVWAALDGPEPARPYNPLPETASEYASDSGPTFGYMTEWGAPLDPSSYNSYSDTGLFYIAKGMTTSNATITANLTAAGYSADERSILFSGSKDSSNTTHWRGRVGVMLGLATWKSGRSGGKFGPGQGGDGDNTIESSELVWAGYPSWRKGGWTWSGYIDAMAKSSNPAEFRYRHGLKTLLDWIMINYPQYAMNNNLWATPQQPLRAVKDAVQTFADTVTAQDSLDQISLEIFAATARHRENLTLDLQRVPDNLYALQSGHWDTSTAISAGMVKAMAELKSERARANASKVMVLMSDGVPNTDESGNYLGEPSVAAKNYVLDRAQDCADDNIRIYTISVGYSADVPLMEQTAAIGRGQHFYAAGSPEEYTEQLQNIFRQIGGKHSVALIE